MNNIGFIKLNSYLNLLTITKIFKIFIVHLIQNKNEQFFNEIDIKKHETDMFNSYMSYNIID